MIGLSAPQGAGKTTLTQYLVQKLQQNGYRAASLSIDDFYLTREEQVKLAKQFSDNPYLQQRGYPGTHDLNLGTRTLESLKEGKSIPLPRYDKSAHQGRGDRCAESTWPTSAPGLDVVFLEGWMLGFQKADGLADPHLRVINEFLPAYKAWTDQLKAFIWLEPEEARYVLEWRVEAEERMKAEGRPGMSRSEIEAYISKFIPAYETYLPGLKGVHPMLHLIIGKNRLPLIDL